MAQTGCRAGTDRLPRQPEHRVDHLKPLSSFGIFRLPVAVRGGRMSDMSASDLPRLADSVEQGRFTTVLACV